LEATGPATHVDRLRRSAAGRWSARCPLPLLL